MIQRPDSTLNRVYICINMNSETTPLACNMLAIPAAERAEHMANWQRLTANAVGVKALTDGYAFQFQPNEETLTSIAQVIRRERLCCPFFRFCVSVEPEGGPMVLALTGRAGVRLFIEAEFAPVLSRFKPA